jgi:TrpR-related protein YerC/YecD
MAYDSKVKSTEVDELFKALLTLETEEDCYRFFEDLCTFKEITSMAQRLKVAKMLKEENTYGEIEAETGASTATISRINKFLQYGSDGYNRILDRLAEMEEAE